MDTYGTVRDLDRVTYANNISLALQDKRNPFEGAFSYINGVAGKEMQAVELIGASDAIIDGVDGGPTPHIPAKHEGIYVRPRMIQWGRQITRGQELGHAIKLTSPYVQEAAAAMKRGAADLMANAFFSPRLIKNDDTGAINSVAFDTVNRTVAANYVYTGAAANSGLIVPKIVKGLELLGFENVDIGMESIWMAITMKQSTDLYNQMQYTSTDYRKTAVFDERVDGQMVAREFLGVKFIIWNRLEKAGSNRRCPMWSQTGMHWGEAIPMLTRLDENASQSYTPHAYNEHWIATTRSEDEKVVDIQCLEA